MKWKGFLIVIIAVIVDILLRLTLGLFLDLLSNPISTNPNPY